MPSHAQGLQGLPRAPLDHRSSRCLAAAGRRSSRCHSSSHVQTWMLLPSHAPHAHAPCVHAPAQGWWQNITTSREQSAAAASCAAQLLLSTAHTLVPLMSTSCMPAMLKACAQVNITSEGPLIRQQSGARRLCSTAKQLAQKLASFRCAPNCQLAACHALFNSPAQLKMCSCAAAHDHHSPA
jgi:hypothetical protein